MSGKRQRLRSAISAFLVGINIIALVGGCASYVTPGRGADFEAFGVRKDADTDASIVRALARRPLAHFPTAVAIVRVQSPGYRSDTAEGWGTGRYSIVTTRDVEKDEQLTRLSAMPMVSGIVPVNRLVLPNELKSDLELRQASAALHADILLIYTLDTTFTIQDKAAPLSVITLGLSPNQDVRVVCTASAAFLDTRNRYIFGVAEATDQAGQIASAWTSASAVDDARRRTENAAFDKLVGELEKTWSGVVKRANATHAADERRVLPMDRPTEFSLLPRRIVFAVRAPQPCVLRGLHRL